MTSPRAQLVNVSYGAYSALFTPQGFALLDSGGYGGFDAYASLGNGTGWNPRFESLLAVGCGRRLPSAGANLHRAE